MATLDDGRALGRQMADRRERLVLLTVLLALFLAALEQTIMAPALANIAADLGDAHLLPWIATSYLLAVTAIAPVMGATADIVGRRPTFFLSLALFIGGSVLAALANSMIMLIIARFIQGAGAGGLVSLPFIVIADKVPVTRRAAYSAYVSTMYAVASVLGPLCGGFFAQYLHWSVIFWLNLPLGGLALAALAIYLSDDEVRSAHRQIDFLGAALLIVAAAASVLGFELLGGLRGLPFGAVPALLVALVAWSGFIWRMLTAKSPLVPIQVMTERTVALASVGMLCVQGTNIGLSLYMPLYFQVEQGLTASQAGLATLGMLGGITSGAYLPAQIVGRTHRYKRVAVVATAGAFAGCLLLVAVMALWPSLPTVIVATAIMGFAIGSLYPVFQVAVQNAAGRARVGAAIGVLGFMRATGASIGVASIGTIAVSLGLTEAGIAGPHAANQFWPLAIVPTLLMLLCLVCMLSLPDRKLTDDLPKAAVRE